MNRLTVVSAPAALIILLIGLWAGICSLFNLPAYLLPTPWAVAEALVQRAPQLGMAALQTIWMAVQALLLSSVLGGGMAVVLSLSRTAERAARPLAIALQVTPIIAIAPLVQIWVGLDRADLAVVILAACVAFFPIFSGVLTGLKSADPDLERLFDLYGATRIQRLKRLRLPSAVPFAFEGLRVAAGLAVIGAVVAEFVAGTGATQGLAWRLLEAANRLRTAEMIAALVWLAALGLGLNGLIALIGRSLTPRCHAPR